MQKWKKYLSGILTAGLTVGLAAYPVQAAETDSAAPDRFPMLEVPQALQTYEADGREVQVFGGFTSLTDGEGATRAVDDSRLLYKRGSILSVSSEFDFYKGRPDQVVLDSVTGSDGTSQYLSVLEQDKSIEDYYTRIKWPEELKNSNIVEISSTLDTSDTVLMVRYSDGMVAAFNYVTGKLLFKDESEKKQLSFGEYFSGWFQGTWDHFFDGVPDGYTNVKNLESEAKTGAFNGMFAFSGNASENGAHEGGELFLTEDGTNDANGDASEKGTDGDLVDGAGDADTSLKIVGGNVVVSGAVAGDDTGSLTQEGSIAASGDSLPADRSFSEEMADAAGVPAADGVKASEDGMTADAATAPDENLPDAGIAAEARDPAEAGDPADAGLTSDDGIDSVDGMPAEAGEIPADISLASAAEMNPAETAMAEETKEAPAADESLTEADTETAAQEEQADDSDDYASEEQEVSGSEKAEDLPENQSEAAGLSAATAGYVTVYDPATDTYALYDTAEYLSDDQEALMSVAEKKEVLNQSSEESIAQQPEETKESKSGIAIVITTVIGVGMLLLLL